MPVIITACVSKKVGQANYGSAGFSLTVQSEVSNLDQVQVESHRLYELLNHSVNRELFEASNAGAQPLLASESIHEEPYHDHHNGRFNGQVNGHANGHKNHHTPSIEHRRQPGLLQRTWKASDKQRDLVLKLVENTGISISVVEQLSEEMFGFGDLPDLNKIQMSGLIDELLSRYGKRQKREAAPTGRFNGRTAR